MTQGLNRNLIELTTRIVASYVACNETPSSTLPELIKDVAHSLQAAEHAQTRPPAGRPAVPIKASVRRSYIICLEDGKRFRTLKRHLRSAFNMTPEDYRAKWGLPDDYPMVAPDYARMRSRLAREIGLGRTYRPGRKRSGPRPLQAA